MASDVITVYRDSLRFVVALPLLAAVPFAAEMIQHVAEVRAGMFTSYAGAEAAAADPGRELFGFIKVLSLFLITYPVIRFLGSGDDRRQAVTVTRTSALLFGAVLLFSLATMALQRVGGPLLAQVIANERWLIAAGLAGLLGLMLLETYLAAWKAGAALGNPRLTAGRSVGIMHPRVLRSFGFTLAMMTPLMIIHYALNFAAIGAAPAAMWTILAIDSAVAASLGIVLAATIYRIAHRAADAAGGPLTPALSGDAAGFGSAGCIAGSSPRP